MSARAWAAWSAAALVVVLTSSNPVYRGLALLIVLNVLLGFRRADAPLRLLLVSVGVAWLLTAAVNTLLSHTGAHVIVTVPAGVPGIGGRVTAEAVLYGLDIGLGIAAAVIAVAPLSRVLYPHDLLDALPAALQRSAAVIGSALNLVPALARNAIEISEAQRLRGSRGRRLSDWRGVAAPVVLSALEDSLQLAEAMEARGFGSGRRTSYATQPLNTRSLAVLGAAIVATGLAITARAGGSFGDWYPFPSMTLPDVAVLPVLACAALAAPLLAWRRS